MHENMKTSMWHTGRSERTWRLPACSTVTWCLDQRTLWISKHIP